MKKSIALLALAFGVTGAYAQDLTSKKGEPMLPEAEDWAIGVDATPFLNYMGNFFGKSSNNTYLASGWQNYGANQTIVAKKFTDAQNAYRVTFRLGFHNTSYKNQVLQPQSTSSTTVYFPTQATTVDDKASTSNSFIGIGVGMEKRKGKTRLQGFYGADVFIWYSSSKEKFKYANALTQPPAASTDPQVNSNSGAYVTDWNSVNSSAFGTSNISTSIPNTTGVNSARVLVRKPGAQFGLGVRAFIGAEYFVLPKISLGGEFGWGLGLAMNMKTKTVWEAEGFDSAGTEQKSEVTVTEKRGMEFILDTDRNAANSSNYNLSPSGTLRLNFHF
jgi:hypothetical protein